MNIFMDGGCFLLHYTLWVCFEINNLSYSSWCENHVVQLVTFSPHPLITHALQGFFQSKNQKPISKADIGFSGTWHTAQASSLCF